jgi:hypothetical protein
MDLDLNRRRFIECVSSFGAGAVLLPGALASAPRSDEEVAFLPLAHLSKLVEARKIAPTDLTKLYLARLKKYDPQLHCVVTVTRSSRCGRPARGIARSPPAAIARTRGVSSAPTRSCP